MSSKIISKQEYDQVSNNSKFISLLETEVLNIVCGYCHRELLIFRRETCRHCGAPLSEGFQLVGIINKTFLYVAVKQLIQID